jgi:hypothetical protein
LSEAAFLTRESELTRQALARTLDELKSSLRTTADLRVWTRRHPWAALGIAAAAGFSAATVVAGRRTNRTSNRAETTRREEAQSADENSDSDSPQPLATTVFSALFDLAKVAIQSSVAAASAANFQSDPPAEEAASQEAAAS